MQYLQKFLFVNYISKLYVSESNPHPLIRRRLSDFIVSKISKLLDSYRNLYILCKKLKNTLILNGLARSDQVPDHPHVSDGGICMNVSWPFGLKHVKEMGTHPGRSMPMLEISILAPWSRGPKIGSLGSVQLSCKFLGKFHETKIV